MQFKREFILGRSAFLPTKVFPKTIFAYRQQHNLPIIIIEYVWACKYAQIDPNRIRNYLRKLGWEKVNIWPLPGANLLTNSIDLLVLEVLQFVVHLSSDNRTKRVIVVG